MKVQVVSRSGRLSSPVCGRGIAKGLVRRGALSKPTVCAVTAPTTSNVGNVEDVGLKDVPLKSLFPDAPPAPAPGAPKLKVAIVGSGLAGLSTAVELLEQGHEVDI